MSLKCMIGKWLHKGQISQEEYDAVMKKLDGHNKQIWNDAIEKVISLTKEKETYNRIRAEKLTNPNVRKDAEAYRIADECIKQADMYKQIIRFLEQLKGTENE